ncbi:2-hydroxyacid dehydrogenase [Pullulanibacillus camelliae]|uniref:2-hydroxyacid dehydrogenase n=1 Tax=Pullulanibacillus camelliae TaxID=1707096 RepID=A0A8J3DY39_9BACL|nr:hydroxyacid dehydrogenase [Pullulanibacillus camelliae]GGE49130.1 2-hydroxyacid dehydrogenase [Pullulanibacillus camelliae]
MVKGLYIMDPEAFERVYPLHIQRQIEKYVDISAELMTKETIKDHMEVLKDVDVILSSWGAPRLDQTFLAHAPQLKAFFYAAGSVKYFVTDAVWERGVVISSAYAANAIPVSEFTLSQILFSLKNGWRYVMNMKRTGQYVKKDSNAIPGVYDKTVGIISLGMIGRRVCELLKPFDVNVIAYDPFISQEVAAELNVRLCSLEEIFRESDVVSLHTPWLEETEGMIKDALFESMKPNAVFINTARGAIVNEKEMVSVLQHRQDVLAILDVTYPEPPDIHSPLLTMENVILTPHIAGSEGDECHRLAGYMTEELLRYLKGVPLKWQITQENMKHLA